MIPALILVMNVIQAIGDVVNHSWTWFAVHTMAALLMLDLVACDYRRWLRAKARRQARKSAA